MEKRYKTRNIYILWASVCLMTQSQSVLRLKGLGLVAKRQIRSENYASFWRLGGWAIISMVRPCESCKFFHFNTLHITVSSDILNYFYRFVRSKRWWRTIVLNSSNFIALFFILAEHILSPCKYIVYNFIDITTYRFGKTTLYTRLAPEPP